eukprot:m51a1_g6396 putative alcohol dehydrogenase (355) ;mRNA; f:211955-213019
MSFEVKAFSATSPTSPLGPTTITRYEPTGHDVRIEILYCGICHSDVHAARDEAHDLMPTTYPIVPGHEIVGRVTAVGPEATQHRVGDVVAVGCLVDTDRTCPNCRRGFEQLCPAMTLTYNAPDRRHGGMTYGGYSEEVVVDEHFVFRVPPNLSLPGVAPLVCAGITAYSPIRRAGVREGTRVAIVGLGGLGHMGVKFALALGAHVAVVTHSPGKREDALRLGAHEVIVSTDEDDMMHHEGCFDFVLDTVAANHDINHNISLLDVDGMMTMVGKQIRPLMVSPFLLKLGRRSIGGSVGGGVAETQEMLDFCGAHNITADVELVPMQRVNEAYERLTRCDVKYRFVIDMATLKSPQ